MLDEVVVDDLDRDDLRVVVPGSKVIGLFTIRRNRRPASPTPPPVETVNVVGVRDGTLQADDEVGRVPDEPPTLDHLRRGEDRHQPPRLQRLQALPHAPSSHPSRDWPAIAAAAQEVPEPSAFASRHRDIPLIRMIGSHPSPGACDRRTRRALRGLRLYFGRPSTPVVAKSGPGKRRGARSSARPLQAAGPAWFSRASAPVDGRGRGPSTPLGLVPIASARSGEAHPCSGSSWTSDDITPPGRAGGLAAPGREGLSRIDPFSTAGGVRPAFAEKSLHFAKVGTGVFPMIRGIPEGGPVAVYRAGETHRAGMPGPPTRSSPDMNGGDGP